MKNNRITMAILTVLFAAVLAAPIHAQQVGRQVGTVFQVNAYSQEILVQYGAAAEPLKMGDAVCLLSGNTTIIMTVVFPMQTSAKCKLLKHFASSISLVQKGMPLYLYKTGNSLDTIRKDFQRLDKITLYNKRVIFGAIISREGDYIIMTTEGRIEVPEKSIKSVVVVK